MIQTMNEENLIEQKFSLATVNQTWFKILAFISFICAVLVNAALIWLVVCRRQRLQLTDEQLKKNAALNRFYAQKISKTDRKKRINFKRRLKYLFLGSLRVKSPRSTIKFATSESAHKIASHEGTLKKIPHEKTFTSNETATTYKKIDKKTLKSKK